MRKQKNGLRTLDLLKEPSNAIISSGVKDEEDLNRMQALKHYQSNQSLIEDFFVIGIDSSDIAAYEKEL